VNENEFLFFRPDEKGEKDEYGAQEGR
jgi:hypothetical protein